MKTKHLATLAALLGTAAIATSQTHPWPMRFGTPARTGQSMAPGALVGEFAWKFRTAGTVQNLAAAANGDIYLSSLFNTNQWSNELFSMGLKPNGDLAFRRKVTPYPWGASQGVGGAPAIDASGNYFLPVGSSILVKYAPSYDQIWTYQANANSVSDSSPAILADGSVRWYQGGAIRAVASTGQVLWTTPYGSNRASVAVAANGDMVTGYARSNEPHGFPYLTYLNSDGTHRWTLQASTGGNNYSAIFGPDNKVYYDGRCYDQVIGTLLFGGGVGIMTPALGKNGQLYTMGGSQIRAQNKDTGAILWTTTLPGALREGVAIDANDVIHATTTNGWMVALSPDGSIRWQVKLCEQFRSSPIIGPNNLVLASGSEGFEHFVYAIR